MREHPLSYEEYMRQRSAGRDPLAEAVQGQSASMERGVVPPPPVKATPEKTVAAFTPPAEFDFFQDVFKPKVESVVNAVVSPGAQQDSDESYSRIPWWEQGSTYSEDQRKDRRTVFMHDDWKRHRSPTRFFRNIKTWPSSGINQALRRSSIVTASPFCRARHMFLYIQGLGVSCTRTARFSTAYQSLSLPALPFSWPRRPRCCSCSARTLRTFAGRGAHALGGSSITAVTSCARKPPCSHDGTQRTQKAAATETRLTSIAA